MTNTTPAIRSADDDISQTAASIRSAMGSWKTIQELKSPTPDALKRAAFLLDRCVQAALTENDTFTGLDELLKFFKENSAGVARSKVALRGATNYTDGKRFTVVSTAFTVIDYVATRVGRAPDLKRAGELCGTPKIAIWAGLRLSGR